ncbi:RDD family protein [Herbiconiux sp. L3-i23]|uniref:RDD family protein n=1 Tax=Herbiconiux sp. L3-i23 TaxID=2905871 RepID=UPI00205C9510|nr:RDD family protein [Herbiconiux sp. L3-i23]BDI21682.1 RDD family protein [Herbiconiux sp. L3-i23]
MADRSATALPDDDDLIVGEAVVLDVRPASVLMRAASLIIDFLASLLVVLLLFLGVGFLSDWELLDSAVFAAVSIAVLVLVTIVLPMIVEFATRGRSLGKLALGLRVVRDDGGAITLRHSFIRALSGLLEIWLTAGGLAAVVGLLNPRAKRIGDILAGTYAQVERVPQATSAVWSVPVELVEWSRSADVATLPDALARRISSFLGNANRMTPTSRARLAESLAAAAAPFVSPLPSTTPELFLAGVSAMRREREREALRLEAERLARLQPVLTALPHDFPDR